MKKAIFGLIFVGAVGSLPASAAPKNVVPASKSQVEQARESMDDLLADSQSARLKDVQIITKSEGLRVICGKVNAKNRYGAYTGYQTFFGIIGQDQKGRDTTLIMGTGEASRRMCEKELSEAQK